jgi:hypothetical protein
VFYYDEPGDFCGIENCLLSVSELEPVGLFDPETNEVTMCEFEDVEEE